MRPRASLSKAIELAGRSSSRRQLTVNFGRDPALDVRRDGGRPPASPIGFKAGQSTRGAASDGRKPECNSEPRGRSQVVVMSRGP